MTTAERMAAIAKEETLRVATSPVRDDMRYLLKRCERLQAVVDALPGAIESEDWSTLYEALDALAEWEQGDVVKYGPP